MAVAVRSRTAASAARAGAPLVGALAACCLYAAFAGGAARPGQELWLQLALAALALAVAGAWLTGARSLPPVPRAAWLGVALLAGFAAWSGLTLAWSVTPDRTWASTNRALAYALAAGLGVVAGATAVRAIERFALAWLGVAAAVALWALTGKVAPGILDDTALTGRLRAPLDYWNALAAVCAFGVPVAVRVATDAGRAALSRLGGLAACWLLLLVVAMTLSRGGLIAVALAVAVATLCGGARLRGLGVVALAGAAALPAIVVAFVDPALAGEGIALDQRIPAGRRLGLVLLVCLAGLLACGRLWLAREERMLGRVRPAVVWRRAGQAALVAAVLFALGLAAGEDGLVGSLSNAAQTFATPSADAVSDPGRFSDAGSGNRWVWWNEAAGAWADRPAGGWGAGSFLVTHRLFRDEPVDVAQPHNVPLQWLAETGLAGLLLAGAGLVLLFAAAVARVRRLPAGRERDLAGALLALAVTWAWHACFEWTWDIPGVTLPAIVALGVLAGRALRRPRPAFPDPEDRGAGVRWAALGLATAAWALYVVSAVLPAWSDAKAGRAQAAASSARTDPQRADAAAQAELAARLDPLAVRPLLAAAAIAEGRDRRAESRDALLRAVRRQPWSATAWARLSEAALALADREGAARAARRWLELDPASPLAQRAAQATATLLAAPPESPTATGTPLPGAPPAAP